MVEEILLGDNPFIGVSHLAQEKGREEAREARLERKIEVLKKALEGGATGFTFSTHIANLELLKHLTEYYPDVIEKLNYYVLVPYAASYVRRSNVVGAPSLAKEFIKNSLRTPRLAIDTLSGILTLNPEKLFKVFIMHELLPYLKIMPREKIRSILLHEILTETIVAYNLAKLVKYLAKAIEKELDVGLGLESRNIEKLVEFVDYNNLVLAYVMTPLNPMNYQVAIFKRSVDELIDSLSRRSRIIAINIMASGTISLDEAIDYLKKFKSKIYAVTSATTKPERAYNNFRKLIQLLD